MEMDLSSGLSFISKAIEKEREDRAWQLWVSVYPHTENPMPFDQFLNQMKKEQHQGNVPLRAEEVIKRAERIKKADQLRG
jgi:hypothetical protein